MRAFCVYLGREVVILVKKILILSGFLITLLLAIPVYAKDKPENTPNSDNAVKNKWHVEGNFQAHPGYDWGGLAEEATWNYKINIKEALDDDNSVGSVQFWTDEIKVVGQVKETRTEYSWAEIAAFGTSDYNGEHYYFMLFYDDKYIWFSLSEEPYDNYLDLGQPYPGSLRVYQLHSLNPTPGEIPFDIGYKSIH